MFVTYYMHSNAKHLENIQKRIEVRQQMLEYTYRMDCETKVYHSVAFPVQRCLAVNHVMHGSQLFILKRSC